MFGLKKETILLLIILVVALFLRVYHLAQIPSGIHGDEASVGYNAYSLLKTGHDQNGNFLPLAIDQFGDFRPAGYHYLDIPFVAVLGLNEFSTRLPAALFGAATTIALYGLVLELLKNKRIAFIAAGLLAISPWHINISRATSEGVIAAFFVILGIYFFLKALRNKNHPLPLFILCIFFAFISFFFYHAPRFFVPAFIPILIALAHFYYKAPRKIILYAIGTYICILIGLFFLLYSAKGANRPLDISLLNIPGGATQLKQSQDEDGTQSPLLTRFYHNKAIFYTRLFLSSYFQHLNGDFLFVSSGMPIRYRMPWQGNVNPIEAPFLVFGFCILLSESIKSKKYVYLLPLAWLILAPIPAGLTWEDIPNVQRASLMIYPLIIITAFGLNEVVTHCNKKTRTIISILFFIILTQNFLYFLHNYFYHSLIQEPWYRSYPSKQLTYSLIDLAKQHKQVVMTTQGNNNLILYLYYSKFDPLVFQRLGSPKEADGVKIQNITLSTNQCPLAGDSNQNARIIENTVFVDQIDCKLPKNAKVTNVFRYSDGTPAYQTIVLTAPVTP